MVKLTIFEWTKYLQALKDKDMKSNLSLWTLSVYHHDFAGVAKFDPATGKQFKAKETTKSITSCFAEALIAEAEADKDIVGIHAAMGGGTGMNMFLRRFPTRCFDVGIAEQHAVTFAAGLACEGLKPFVAIYSSFIQRGYDQVSIINNFGVLLSVTDNVMSYCYQC